MATTPGNFPQGVSAAAATGADAYLTGRDEAEDERFKVQQLVQMQQQKDQDRRLSLLMDAIGVNRNQISDKRAQESHESGLEKDRAYMDYYKRRGVGAGATLSPAQEQTNRRAARQELRLERNRLRDAVKSFEMTQEEADAELAQIKTDIFDYYGITSLDDTPANSPQVAAPGAAPGRNITQADLFAKQGGAEEMQQPAITKPPSGGIREGATATNPQTGERVIYRNGQWQPL